MAADPVLRVAVIGPDAARLRALLEATSSRPEVRVLADLYGSVSALMRSPPHSLWVDVEPLAEEDLGALRLLRSLLPETRLLLTASGAHGGRATRFAQALGGEVVERPFRAEHVTAALLAGAPPAALRSEDATALVIRGLGDEIGNPLLFAVGYLQLLSLSVDPTTQSELSEKIELVRAGLDRINKSLARLRQLTEPQRPVLRPTDLRALLGAAGERIRPRLMARRLRLEPDAAALPTALVPADPERATTALELVLGTLVELATPDTVVRLGGSLEGTPPGYRIELECETSQAAELPLARAFEPYAFAARLRGTDVGLNLALARALLGAQGAAARMAQAGSGRLLVQIHWPAAATAGE